MSIAVNPKQELIDGTTALQIAKIGQTTRSCSRTLSLRYSPAPTDLTDKYVEVATERNFIYGRKPDPGENG